MSLPEGPLSTPDLYYRSRGSPAHYSNTTMPLSYPCCDMTLFFYRCEENENADFFKLDDSMRLSAKNGIMLVAQEMMDFCHFDQI
ncbi:unnamed protein product [Acanthocheilonema viteae]|uniref:Uncharacterized protein n=1 Tax=Acanthocheilonema viteae TaxID=6277 RepID=A0A498SJN3_ACAVI|nr:unnamed protein product [Acanthocheilonema viteae]